MKISGYLAILTVIFIVFTSVCAELDLVPLGWGMGTISVFCSVCCLVKYLGNE